MTNRGLRAKLRYAFDKSMAAGTVALIGYLALVSFAVVGFAAALVALGGIEPVGDDMDFVEAFWAALLRTLDPGTMSDDQGWGFRIVMLAVTLTGVSIVAVLIGVITTGLQSKLDQLRQGRSLVLEDDHSIIFNWSDSIFEVIAQLAIANQSRFRPRIVVLAERDKVEMESEIAAKVPDLKNSKVICRTGDPTDLDDIHIVNPAECRSIIILSPDTSDPDASVIKSILALVSDPQRREKPYRIAAEIRDKADAEVARVVGGAEVQLVLADNLISRIIVHSTRQPGLSAVYTELLDFEGCEIYAVRIAELEGMTFGEALLRFEDCSLIGLSPDGERIRLNPPMDTIVPQGARLILIAEDDERIALSDPPEHESIAAPSTPAPAADAPERTLMFGWNRLAPTIVRELARYVAPGSLLTIAASDIGRAESALADLDLGATGLKVEVKRVATARRSQVEALDPLSYDHVLVLGCSDEMEAQAADTRTLIALLHLRAIREEADASLNIVSEVLDVRNVALAERARVDDFVVSSKLVSLMLAQASENALFEGIFEDFLDEEGSEIYMRSAAELVPLGEDTDFYGVVRRAAARGEAAIGHVLSASGESTSRIIVNPRKSDRVRYREGDRIIVLARS